MVRARGLGRSGRPAAATGRGRLARPRREQASCVVIRPGVVRPPTGPGRDRRGRCRGRSPGGHRARLQRLDPLERSGHSDRHGTGTDSPRLASDDDDRRPRRKRSGADDDTQAGDSGPQVKTLQRELKSLGFSIGTIDGAYGAETSRAVTAFQKAHHLTADGIVGPATLTALAP
jgi:Putative peptidoglycan binding domain